MASTMPSGISTPAAPSTVAPSSGATPTDGSSAAPAPTPTSKPAPTLNWDAAGFAATVKDPVSIGSKAKVTLKGPVGPTCALKIKYPSGITATLPSPTHPTAGSWQWTWTIPSKAKAGKATGTTTCTYYGVPHLGNVSFRILDPTLPDGWDIVATMPSTRSSADATALIVHVTIKGVLPVDPTHDQDIACYLDLVGPGSSKNLLLADYPWHAGDGPLTLPYDVGVLGPDYVGTDTFTVRCRNEFGTPFTWQSDSGTITIT
ncbi:MAG TPA: hypothetical protein VGM49_02645 [Candidatus Limnocylindrales bacterium]